MDGHRWQKQSAMEIVQPVIFLLIISINFKQVTKRQIIQIVHFCCVISVCCLLKKLKEQAREQAKDRKPNLVKALKEMGDFYMEFKWDFQSWGKIHSIDLFHFIDFTFIHFNQLTLFPPTFLYSSIGFAHTAIGHLQNPQMWLIDSPGYNARRFFGHALGAR